MTNKLVPPEGGVTVRMYRQGHGDCFLLALPPSGADVADVADDAEPVYVLVDCGLKPGSQRFLRHKKDIDTVVEHIAASTGGRLDLVVITHEHQDHVNGLSERFEEFDIGEAWLAWTEDPDDEVANELRRRHRDALLGLARARNKLALAVGEASPTVDRLDTFLGLELGDELAGRGAEAILAAAGDPSKSVNKRAMARIKRGARKRRGVRFLSPGDTRPLPGTAVRAYVLGPPRDADLLADEDPHDGEGFPDAAHAFSMAGALSSDEEVRQPPFAKRYCVPRDRAFVPEKEKPSFFQTHYGAEGEGGGDDLARLAAVPSNASWRRIDDEWLYSAENLALKLNQGINNTSLVLALELPRTKKVLLFVGDAQRGNWISWSGLSWQGTGGDGDERLTTRDLLARTVLYKVGHHGSHNATLDGEPSSPHPNLSWMGTGHFGAELTAMITAVNKWALAKNRPPWRHPLPAIKAALHAKARGRVLQTDCDPARPDDVAAEDWESFAGRCSFDPLYFDVQIFDDWEVSPRRGSPTRRRPRPDRPRPPRRRARRAGRGAS